MKNGKRYGRTLVTECISELCVATSFCANFSPRCPSPLERVRGALNAHRSRPDEEYKKGDNNYLN